MVKIVIQFLYLPFLKYHHLKSVHFVKRVNLNQTSVMS